MPAMSATVRYAVRIREPHRHIVEVTADFPPTKTGHHDLHLPVWTPGSYLVRDFARNLTAVTARDASRKRVPVEKIAKSTWRAEGASGRLRVRYEVYANEPSVRTSHVTSEHAFLSGPTLFLYTDEHRALPCELQVTVPRGFRVAVALPERRGRFRAADYDELVDSPLECGHLRELRFEVASTPFRAVFCGRGSEDRARIRRDFRRIAEAERAVFGSFPFASYLAIVNLTPSGRGGLEHRASTALEWPRFRFRGEKYEDFLALFAHELFHAWNVKAAAPAAFRPYDYRRETPTRLLWWFEGVTDYYDELLLRRAGLLTPKRYLERVAERWERLCATPGRLRMSVADASFDAWIKHYRPDENSSNSAVSYYEKGHLVGLLLDLEIRRLTRGDRSLDDVTRLVFERGRDGIGEDGVRLAASEVAGSDLAPWFKRYVHGIDELPMARGLASVGLALEEKTPEKEPGETRGRTPRGGWLGVNLKSAGGRLTIASVVTAGPADDAGLAAHDEIVAVDGVRVDEQSMRERLAEHDPGARVRITYFREEILGEVRVRLGATPVKLRIVAASGASAQAREILEGWLGAEAAELRQLPARTGGRDRRPRPSTEVPSRPGRAQARSSRR